ncbi:cytochrome b561 [Pseudomonas cuatrocienegasensis]|uniref:Cytochrome b561 n=1 Tax=Pseudomonas cuatrocienegasensis TaxID=543360 RepID=A0ABY1B082_9PSED|nr:MULTISPECIES: cytochrome b/b6 domain-containing protein [Pseudomonas]OEC36152.1 hypothetical protein A7D25_06040 [Pseudomonas sp. 21C1]SEP61960.1 cytochrome b561 [Pseudomonas cuatrocienegasensis]
MPKSLHSNALDSSGAPETTAFHPSIRTLHWAMAIGFVLMWLTGVLVTNIEGVPYFVDGDRQGLIRDLHKSIGFTLLALLCLRLGLRLWHKTPALPTTISPSGRKAAKAGHIALYAAVVLACVTGFAIADLHEYGNAYFGIELPQIFPTREHVAGWAVTPWSYIAHAVLAYGLLALVVGHVAAVWLHARSHKVDLLPRVLSRAGKNPRPVLTRIVLIALCISVVVTALAVRGFVTLGQLEEPRDYKQTTPFSKSAEVMP